MNLADLRVLVCIHCGRNDRPLRKLPASVWPNARACDLCWTQFGEASLARAADELLAGAKHGAKLGACLHCGGPVIAYDSGLAPAWCSECERERQRLLAGGTG